MGSIADALAQHAHPRVALLFAGGAFRAVGSNRGQAGVQTACSVKSSMHEQRQASMSYKDRFMRPLEGLGAEVDVIIALTNCYHREGDGEHALALLRAWFSPHVCGAALWNSTGVGISWLQAYKMLDKVQRAVPSRKYDYVFRSRPDLYLIHDVTRWRGDFHRLLFQRKCVMCDELDSTQRCTGHSPERDVEVNRMLATAPECQVFVDDKMLWSPQRWVPTILQRLRLDLLESRINDLGAHGCIDTSQYTHNWARSCLTKPVVLTTRGAQGPSRCNLAMAKTARLISDCAFMGAGAEWEFRPQRDYSGRTNETPDGYRHRTTSNGRYEDG